ncbi:MAG: glycosyltransferase [Pegethrix bostrychoides GSE-TBD4-15B]|jgi:glycosyltransferase involved in cell wall biosynthesis|uniref:Glycosyltransferase n=1 Tax=Pegethrix bostrychoides GSE-TBD4-15B TaxID=2839662 RepID=A0A951PDK4_9CYAN|nr:glycosyltransferase [Pegethrix bostrychoides GSE-TBD4-15B]
MNVQPKVSVLIPVYNAEKYLSKALESILSQTFTDFEVMAVDDGSTDKSLDILKQFAKQDQRILVLSRPNTGIVGALNDGLALLSGQYVARIDADDIALPHLFEQQVSFLDSHSDHVAVGCRVLFIDPSGLPIREANDVLEHEEIDQLHLAGHGTFPHSGSMIRRDALLKIEGYCKAAELSEDIDLWLRLAEIGRLENLPDVLLQYRLHFQSIGHSKSVRQQQANAWVVNEAHVRRGLVPPPPKQINTKSRVSEITYQTWAWWALQGGHLDTARKYALLVLRKKPLAIDSWKLLACVARGNR